MEPVSGGRLRLREDVRRTGDFATHAESRFLLQNGCGFAPRRPRKPRRIRRGAQVRTRKTPGISSLSSAPLLRRKRRWRGAGTAAVSKITDLDAHANIVYMRIEFKCDSWPPIRISANHFRGLKNRSAPVSVPFLFDPVSVPHGELADPWCYP